MGLIGLLALFGYREFLLDQRGHIAQHQGAGAAEDPRHGVVVLHGDRVKLVGMAAGAADGHAQHRAANGFDLFIDGVHPQQFLVLQIEVFRPQGEEGSCHQLAFSRRSRSVRQEVPGDLFGNELSVRHVVIERPNHVIAIAPGIGQHRTAPSTGGFSVTG